MSQTLIDAGVDLIAAKVHEQLLILREQVSGAVADAVALSVISGAAAAFRELSREAFDVQDKLIVEAARRPGPRAH